MSDKMHACARPFKLETRHAKFNTYAFASFP